MTLQNLLRIGKLKDHAPTAAEVLRLLAAVDRNLADAAVPKVSDETRFDAAYQAPQNRSSMAIKLPSHLHRSRSGVLHFRIAIPVDLRHHFDIKEIYRSLRTASVRHP
jgi:hypothetical protein